MAFWNLGHVSMALSFLCLSHAFNVPVDHSAKPIANLKYYVALPPLSCPLYILAAKYGRKKNTSLSGWFWVESMVCAVPASISSFSNERACFQAESWSQSTSPRDQDGTLRFSFMVMIPLGIIVTFSLPALSNFKLANAPFLPKLLIFYIFLVPLPLSQEQWVTCTMYNLNVAVT